MNTFLFLYWMFSQFLYTDSHELTIQIHGMESTDGQILLAVYDKQENFMDEDHSFEKRVIQLKGTTNLSFKINLPAGDYAVTLFHDLNSDNELNTNMIGIPKEPYGFSNNPKIRFGPPDFDEAKFQLREDESISISLK